MGKSTISMAIFNSYVTNYQRVDVLHAMKPNMSTSRHRSRRAFWLRDLRVHITVSRLCDSHQKPESTGKRCYRCPLDFSSSGDEKPLSQRERLFGEVPGWSLWVPSCDHEWGHSPESLDLDGFHESFDAGERVACCRGEPTNPRMDPLWCLDVADVFSVFPVIPSGNLT